MTEISEAAWAETFKRANEQGASWQNVGAMHRTTDGARTAQAFARFIQEVSDAAKKARELLDENEKAEAYDSLAPFILPEPVDPLAEAMEREYRHVDSEVVAASAKRIRETLRTLGFKIVEDTTIKSKGTDR